MVLWLIEQGFDVNGQTPDGRTIVYNYAWNNQLQAVKALTERGASVTIADHVHHATPLGFALHDRARESADFLLELLLLHGAR